MTARRNGHGRPNGKGATAHHNAKTSPQDWPRAQVAAGARTACAVFRGFENIRRVQMTAAHRALARHEAAAARLAQPCHALDLVSLQAELTRFDFHAAAAYWQQLGVAMLDMQRDLLGEVASAAQHDVEAGAQALPAFGEATLPAAAAPAEAIRH